MSSSLGGGWGGDPPDAPGQGGFQEDPYAEGAVGQPGYDYPAGTGQPSYPQEGYGQETYSQGASSAEYADPGTTGAYTGDAHAGGASVAYDSTGYQSQGGASAATSGRPDVEDESVGSLVGNLTNNLSKLMRQELALAKAELREEGKKAGAAAGMLAGAGLAGLLFLVFLSLTLMWLLDKAMDVWLAALIVTLLWGILAAALGLMGKKRLAEVNPKPEQTIETLKEDKEWVQAQKN